MEEELDGFDFVLARHLGRTIDELSAMPQREYLAWRAWFVYQAAIAKMQPAGGG